MQLPDYMSQKRFFKWLPFVLFFLAGLMSGLFIDEYAERDERKSLVGKELRQKGYRFTNPLLECETAKDTIGDRELRPFRYKIQKFIDDNEMITGDRVSHISVYFRDLNNGPWFGINEKEKFSPASLLKVPIMFAYLKLAESNPQLLKKELVNNINEDHNEVQYFKPSRIMERGKTYMVDDLIYRMIAYSDNNAMELLAANLSPVLYYKVFMDMGLAIPNIRKAEDYMSVKEYAAFFRILFNSTYLSREMSEKALKYLSESDFKLGIAGGVSPSTSVAHKFGEHVADAGIAGKQLHDCGIIYYPDRPYLLCVMTRGKEFEKLDDVIRNISYLVFNEIDSQSLGNPVQNNVLPIEGF